MGPSAPDGNGFGNDWALGWVLCPHQPEILASPCECDFFQATPVIRRALAAGVATSTSFSCSRNTADHASRLVCRWLARSRDPACPVFDVSVLESDDIALAFCWVPNAYAAGSNLSKKERPENEWMIPFVTSSFVGTIWERKSTQGRTTTQSTRNTPLRIVAHCGGTQLSAA